MKNTFRTFLFFFMILFISSLKNIKAQVSWSQVDGPYGGTINDIHVTSNGYIFIATYNGIFRSTNNGQNWMKKITGLYSSTINVIAGNLADELYVGVPGGSIFKSSNYGDSWTKVNPGMTSSGIIALNIGKNNFIYAVNGGFPGDVFLSEDNGNSWQNIAEDLTSRMKDIVINDSGYVYVISDWQGVFRTKNNGEIWEVINDSLGNDNVSTIAIMKNGLLIIGIGNDLYISDNFGDYWEKRFDNLSTGPISTIYVDSLDQIYLGTLHGEVYFSADSGYSWELLNENFNIEEITCLAVSMEGSVLVGTSATGVLKTENDGNTWEYINQDLTNLYCTSLLVDSSGRILFGSYEGIFRSDSEGKNWEPINRGLYPGMLGYEVIALSQTISGKIFAASHEGVYVFDEQNIQWEFLTWIECSAMLINDSSYIIVGTYLSGIYRSVDGGDSWQNVYTHDGANYTDIGDFTQNSLGDIFAGTDKGILKSIDNGKSWELISTQVIAGGSQSLSCSANDILYTGVYGYGVYRSEDSGYTWLPINNGFSNTYITSLISNSTGQTYMGGGLGYNAGVFQISDNLDSWIQISSGLFNTNVSSLTLDDEEYIYAGTRDGFLFKSNKTTTAIKSNSPINPISFNLEQNYPNPFNPTTKIKYSIPTSPLNPSPYQGEGQRERLVTLKIYDVLGTEIAILVNNEKPVGTYEVEWDASRFPSGVYFYQLKAGSFIETKKMILLR